MQTAKILSDWANRRLIWVLAGHSSLIVGFVMRWLKLYVSIPSYLELQGKVSENTGNIKKKILLLQCCHGIDSYNLQVKKGEGVGGEGVLSCSVW